VIDPTARVHPEARLGAGVEVGPFCVVDAQVEIGAGTVLGAHVVVTGRTRIGARNRFFPFCVIGAEPQDKKFAGEDTRLEIGDDNTVREYCTINRGTVQGGGITRMGDDNWVMAYAHLAHDCVVGSHTIFANGASLAGHVRVDDHAILGGFALVHQFCAIGAHAFVAASALVLRDVPPFVMASGNPAQPRGINQEGLRRRAFDTADVQAIRGAYRTLYRSGLKLSEALAALEAAGSPHVTAMAAFIRESQRGIIR
jgi:UDP-N-acetylglucosamine acyltransferase